MISLVIVIEGITFYFCQTNDEAASEKGGGERRGEEGIVILL